jgi:3-mercaptopropionate dioxygenase
MQPLLTFVQRVTKALDAATDERAVVSVVKSSMADLVASSDWLPAEFTKPAAGSYGQHLLYCDPLERFCVVSFVWPPNQKTPVHDHTVWGVIGQLIGEEESQAYTVAPSGELVAHGKPAVLQPGQICTVSPLEIDVHVVRNPSTTANSIGIHAYGANIARVQRHTYDLATGAKSAFMSGYSNAMLPNIYG